MKLAGCPDFRSATFLGREVTPVAKVRGPNALQGLAKEAEPLMPGFIANARTLYRGFMNAAMPAMAK